MDIIGAKGASTLNYTSMNDTKKVNNKVDVTSNTAEDLSIENSSS